MSNREDVLSSIVQQQQLTIDIMVTAVQQAERRMWSMFILGLIIGFSVGYYV